MESQTKKTLVVVGGGQSGVSIVASLIQLSNHNIVWIDPKFKTGDFQKFIDIPSNTPYLINLMWVKKFEIFDKYNTCQNAELKEKYGTQLFSENGFPSNNVLREVIRRMTLIIQQQHSQRVKMVYSLVDKVVETNDDKFIVFAENEKWTADLLFLALGGEPKKLKNYKENIPRLRLFDILSPTLIQQYDFTNKIIQVHGSSHSSMLAVQNLVKMKRPPERIINRLSRPYRFLQVQGLKIVKNMYGGVFGLSKDFGLKLLAGQYDNKVELTLEPINRNTDFIVQAIGFEQRKINFQSKEGIKDYQDQFGTLCTNNRKINNIYQIGLIHAYDQQLQRQVTSRFITRIAMEVYEFAKHLHEKGQI